jgi:hypothetical protein
MKKYLILEQPKKKVDASPRKVDDTQSSAKKYPVGPKTPELTKQLLDAREQAPEFLEKSIIIRKNEQGKEEIVIAGYLSDGTTKYFFPLFKDTDGKWKWRNPENNNIPETLEEY